MDVRRGVADCACDYAIQPDTQTASLRRGQPDKIDALQTGGLHPEAKMKPHFPAHDAGKSVHHAIAVQYDVQL